MDSACRGPSLNDIAIELRLCLSWLRFRRRGRRYKLQARWWRLIKRASLVILLGFAALAVIGSPSLFSDVVVWVLLLFLWLGFVYEGQAWLTAWTTQRNNRHIVAGQEHTLSATGCRVRCGEADSTMTWTGFERLVETREFFLAFPMRNAAYYLPKRCLSAEQIGQVREFFREHGGEMR